ncbi:MAG: YCF48-related protein [Ignavibacteriaceae bacterium]|nr:YCF48-related protein [Ignavibacteriaceae bacterium]
MRSILFLYIFFNISTGSTLCQNLWEKIPSPTTQNLQKIVFVDSLNGWAVGDSGAIIHTTDEGNTWNTQNSGINLNLLSITFPTKDIGWALAWTNATPYGTIILHTTDGGNSWKNEFYNGQDVFLNSIYFIDSLNGWIGGNYSGILYTNNGGQLWNQAVIDSFAGFPIYNFIFTNKNYGFANGGSTDFMGVIYKTSDSGKNWTGKSVAADPIQKIYFLDSNNIVGMGGDLEFGAGFIKSTNAGNDWVYKTLNIYGTALGISFRTSSEAWAPIKGGFFGRFIFTNDSGNTWNEYDTPDSLFMFDVAFIDSTHGFAVGLNGAILKYIGAVTSVKEPMEKVSGFMLKQNYPNPFNPSTTISFVIPEKSNVSLRVFDILGREVKAFDQKMDAGEHGIKFLSNNLPSGVYIYTLIANNYMSSKKMIILK